MKPSIYALAAAAAAACIPSAWALGPATRLAPPFVDPVFLTAPAGDARLFVVERAGVVKLFDGAVASTWLDISSQVATEGERGLLGLAFDPAFANNGRFYVNYIDKATHNTVVASYTAANPAANAPVDTGTARNVLTIAQPPAFSNHKAGWIGFRPGENNLYVATGDGGGSNDPDNRAQNLADPLGKILRVTPQAGGGYTVPSSNPHAGSPVWDHGLRNPFRNSFDRSTGDLWIGDVGQNTREEINFEAAGSPGGNNYGWRPLEGSGDNPGVPDAPPPGAVAPLFDYEHPAGQARAVIGGYVYRGSAEPGLDGTYFFGDFSTGRIFSLRRLADGTVAEFTDRTAEFGTPFGAFEMSSFGEDGVGNLYALGLGAEGGVFLLASAVPELHTALMFALGLAGIAAWRRRMSGG